ncbi:17357_t:CDS:10 [Funneliformis geosporum]|uniref:17357_t:CDS:1 n=1 Tax=Funneliformis geosporum TaxID=1117311 RepID=A0A9W4WKR1_9GLOM|nr:17357_t:CDS:10 [Funneliformis geosporum]
MVFVGLTFGIFLAALDQTIVATTLSAIAVEFSVLDQIEWVGTAYLLTATASQPTYGKFADIFGRKMTFLMAIFLFEIGSLICGLAPNMVTLIIARAISGVGGGGIFGLVFIIIADIVSLRDRGKYQGMISGVFAFASIVGPFLGGAFTDSITWRWAFYINLPFGAVTVTCVVFFLHLPHPSGSILEKIKRIDWWGTIVLVGSTVAILLPLGWGGSKYEWNSSLIIVLLCVGVLGFIAFAFVERHIAVEPIAPGRLFKNITVAACFGVNFFQGMAFYGLIYFIPLFFKFVRGVSATQAGLELLPFILGVDFASIVAGQLVSRTNKISYKIICIVGGILIMIGAGLTSIFNEYSSRAEFVGYLLIGGIGIGCIMHITLLASQQVVGYRDIASVTSLLSFFRTIGAVFGLAILATTFDNELNRNLPKEFQKAVGVYKVFGEDLKHMPESDRKIIKHAFVLSLSPAFKVIIVMGALATISALYNWLRRYTYWGNPLTWVENYRRKNTIDECYNSLGEDMAYFYGFFIKITGRIIEPEAHRGHSLRKLLVRMSTLCYDYSAEPHADPTFAGKSLPWAEMGCIHKDSVKSKICIEKTIKVGSKFVQVAFGEVIGNAVKRDGKKYNDDKEKMLKGSRSRRFELLVYRKEFLCIRCIGLMGYLIDQFNRFTISDTSPDLENISDIK